MITHSSIEEAYAFLHQKWRVYSQSTSASQRDDIEYAIAEYAGSMSKELYARLSQGRSDYLLSHASFAADMADAVEQLERLL